MTRRNYVTAKQLAAIDNDLTDIDRQVLGDVARFRLMSAKQLQLLHFGTLPRHERRSRRTLVKLVDQSVLDRLPRRVGGRGKGSDSTLYRLGRAGRRLIGASSAAGPSWQPSATFAAHTLAIVDLYVEMRQTEQLGRLSVGQFSPEPGAWRQFTWKMKPVTLKPDAFARINVDDVSWQYFIEVDRGTESSKVIARKCQTYLDYLDTRPPDETFPAVLFLVDSQRSYHSPDSDDRVRQIEAVVADQAEPAAQLFVVRRRDRPPWEHHKPATE